MKKMIIAVMMGAMLMPAQMFAKEDRVNEKPRVENNEKRKEIRIGNDRDNRLVDNKPNVRSDNRPDNKPNVKPNDKPNNKPKNKPKNDYRPNNNPGKPAPVVVVNKPAPKPEPPRNNDNGGIFDAIAGFFSIVGIMALVAN